MTDLLQVSASDGIQLAVYRAGDPAAPPVVAIHGYPDNAGVWEPVVALLRERFYVVSYDVRGAGRSGTPAGRAGYRLDQLEADLDAVLQAVSPDRPVHLLAHDWGSIQGWQCVTGSRLRGRIASYTSISGPGLGMSARWLRSKLRPSGRDLATVARQLGRSSYLVLFQVPGLAELGWRSGLLDRLMGKPSRSDPDELADRLHGLQLYRANRRPPAGAPAAVDIPVQVLAPSGDRYVGVALQAEAPAPYVRDLRVRTVPGGHWIMRRHPEVVAQACAELVDEVEAATG
ncbi:alpha/beta fold hydrolase [Jatrophihabitans sp.]|uniref:alpha/beta fold hydrolase n=1 Tax=Jatrophihabitans sp. TaxID=1932789 RepID=UPI002B588C87|nr:alpha/beta fold hydrolase [Jatrophihabitans sp.]